MATITIAPGRNIDVPDEVWNKAVTTVRNGGDVNDALNTLSADYEKATGTHSNEGGTAFILGTATQNLKNGGTPIYQALVSKLQDPNWDISQSSLDAKSGISVAGTKLATPSTPASNTTAQPTSSTVAGVYPKGTVLQRNDGVQFIADGETKYGRTYTAVGTTTTPPSGSGQVTAPISVMPLPVNNGVTNPPATIGNVTPASGLTFSSTGNPDLDKILQSITQVGQGIIDNGYTIPKGLQITPELTAQFLNWAHQVVDPQTQQMLLSKIDDINSSLVNETNLYNNQKGEVIQNYGTNLADEQNTAGANGTAFSGQRAINERNLTDTANRTLGSLASNASKNTGDTLRAGAAEVGAPYASMFRLPDIAGGSVSNLGGQRGTSNAGDKISFGGYNPSTYQAGNIQTGQIKALDDQQAKYQSDYLKKAALNSGLSQGDIIKQLPGLPQGFQLPANLS